MIFVVGTGRSGTSTVARLVHQSGRACMGHNFVSPDRLNPDGYWEDMTVRKSIRSLIKGDIERFLEKLHAAHEEYGCKADNIGFKHPLLFEVPRQVWMDLSNKDPGLFLYWAIRPEELVIPSAVRVWVFRGQRRKGDKEARTLYHNRMGALEKNVRGLPFAKIIDFSEPRTDAWVLSKL